MVLTSFFHLFSLSVILVHSANALVLPTSSIAARDDGRVTGKLYAVGYDQATLPKAPVYYADGHGYIGKSPANATIAYPLRCSANSVNSTIECVDDTTGLPHSATGVVAVLVDIPVAHRFGNFLQRLSFPSAEGLQQKAADVQYHYFGIVGKEIGVRWSPDYELTLYWWTTIQDNKQLLGWRTGPRNGTLDVGTGLHLYLE